MALPSSGVLSEEFIRNAGKYMLVETPLARADFALAFGCYDADKIARRAATLYHQGHFDFIVAAGGNLSDSGQKEAHRMFDVMSSEGVPYDKIVIEDQSQHTGENVLFTRNLLQRLGLLDRMQSVLGIGQFHASRRFLMTLTRHMPDVTPMFTHPDPESVYGVPRTQWHTHQALRKLVLQEYAKKEPYLDRGFTREIDPGVLHRKIKSLPAVKAAR